MADEIEEQKLVRITYLYLLTTEVSGGHTIVDSFLMSSWIDKNNAFVIVAEA